MDFELIDHEDCSSVIYCEQDQLIDTIKASLRDRNDGPTHVCLLGATGTGKSSLINALRGIANSEPDSAYVDTDGEYQALTGYIDASNPKIIFWDASGYGAICESKKGYFKRFEFGDVFIVVSATRLKPLDVFILHEATQLGKTVLFVLNKIDKVLSSDIKALPLELQNMEVENAKSKCIMQLSEEGIENIPVFVISALDNCQWDFEQLASTVINQYLELKKLSTLQDMLCKMKMRIERQRTMLEHEVKNAEKKAALRCLSSKPFAYSKVYESILSEETEIIGRELGIENLSDSEVLCIRTRDMLAMLEKTRLIPVFGTVNSCLQARKCMRETLEKLLEYSVEVSHIRWYSVIEQLVNNEINE